MKLNVNNTEKIEAALHAVNGMATAHTYNTQLDILDVCSVVGAKLEGWVGGRKNWRGARVVAISGERVARAYKYGRRATRVTLEFCTTGWLMTDAQAVNIYQHGGSVEIHLTRAQDNLAVCRLRDQYSIIAGSLCP